MNGSNFVKVPLRTNATLNIENFDKYCFICSILFSLHPCNNINPNRISNYEQYLNELNIQGFDFSYGKKCNDVHNFDELNSLSINMFEIKIYQDQNKWGHKIIPIEISKNNTDRVIDLAIYKNHCCLIKDLDLFLRGHNKRLFVENALVHIQVKIC